MSAPGRYARPSDAVATHGTVITCLMSCGLILKLTTAAPPFRSISSTTSIPVLPVNFAIPATLLPTHSCLKQRAILIVSPPSRLSSPSRMIWRNLLPYSSESSRFPTGSNVSYRSATCSGYQDNSRVCGGVVCVGFRGPSWLIDTGVSLHGAITESNPF